MKELLICSFYPKIGLLQVTFYEHFQLILKSTTIFNLSFITISKILIVIVSLKYNSIDMKKRTSQKVLRPNRKMASSVKQLAVSTNGSSSVKAPKKRVQRKNRQFGDDITNLREQPVFQQIEEQVLGLTLEQNRPKIS